MKLRMLLAILAFGSSQLACSSTIQVHDISSGLAPKQAAPPAADGADQAGGKQKTAPPDRVKGLPFRVLESATVRVYKRTSSGEYQQVFSQRQTLPNPDRLFALAFTAEQLADNILGIELRSNGALSKMELSNVLKSDEAITALSDKGLGALNALATIDEQRAAKELALLQSETARAAALEAPVAAKEALLAAALAALNAADAAALALDQLASDAPEADRAAAKADLRLKRLQANHAYRKAGLAEPFPGTFP